VDEATLVLRVVIGGLMFYHGTDKLFRWWGSNGITDSLEFFKSRGYRPPLMMAYAAGVTEAVGGLLLLAGAATYLALAMLVGVVVNILCVHLRSGLDNRRGGCEFDLTLLAALVAIALLGPGLYSIDHLIGVPGPAGLVAASLALGVLSGLGIVASRRPSTGAVRPSSETGRR